jgi:nucleoside diphosphate kinase
VEKAGYYPYFDEDLSREHTHGDGDFREVVSLLQDERLLQEAEAGNITLAMIRPQVGPEANLLGLSDLECAEKIEEMITNLGVVAKFSINFDVEVVDEFYSGAPQETMLGAAAEDQEKYSSRWPEFKDFMSSGPTTILILHSPNGDAIEQWRAHLGHWNIEKFRDPATIRGALAVNLFNNLVHGSDAPESVIRELGLIRRQLDKNR